MRKKSRENENKLKSEKSSLAAQVEELLEKMTAMEAAEKEKEEEHQKTVEDLRRRYARTNIASPLS